MNRLKIMLLAVVILASAGINAQTWCTDSPMMKPDSVVAWKFTSSGDSSLTGKVTYQYDASLRITQQEEFTREPAMNIWIPYRKENHVYNSLGKPELYAVYFWNNSYASYAGLCRERFVYDATGNEVELFHDLWNFTSFEWINSLKILSSYYEQDQLLNTVNFEWNGSTGDWDSTAFSEYIYNSGGQLTLQTDWESDEGSGIFYPVTRFSYEYDLRGNVIRLTEQVYNHNTQLWYHATKKEYTWDGENRLTFTIYFEYDEPLADWIAKEREERGYDNAGNFSLYAYYRIGEDLTTWNKDMKQELTFNTFNKMVEQTHFEGNNENEWQPTYRREYHYQQDTLLQKEFFLEWNISNGVWTEMENHEYTYDSLTRRSTDSFFKWDVFTQSLELNKRSYYFYAKPGPFGIDEKPQVTVNIYPNPSTGKFWVQRATNNVLEVQIDLIEKSGKTVTTIYNGFWRSGILEFDVSYLPGGTYFCRMVMFGGIITKKLILIR